jgi:hypothetical protein
MNNSIKKKLMPVATKTLSQRAPKKPEEVISFRGASNVSKRFYDAVHQQVREVLHVLETLPQATVTAEDLCGEEFWGTSAKRQRLIGKCLANAVDEGLLPLEIVNRKSSLLKYRLIRPSTRTVTEATCEAAVHSNHNQG